jgi:hypothetical protein
LAQEFALGLGVGGGTRFAWRSASSGEADAYIGGLDSGAVGQKKVAKGDGRGDAIRNARIFVALFDAIFEGDQGLLYTLASETGRLGAGHGFSGGSGDPVVGAARRSFLVGRLAAASRLDVTLRLQEGEGLLGFAAIDF